MADSRPAMNDALEESPARKKLLELFSFGFDSWLVRKTPEEVFERLKNLKGSPIGHSQLNQLLHLCHEPGVSVDFFRYYWFSTPVEHPYDVRKISEFRSVYLSDDLIYSLQHLKWGLYRLYVDSLLYFGDIRMGFEVLRGMSRPELEAFFGSKCYDTEGMKRRGPVLPLKPIAKDKRYLISEMACKSYAPPQGQQGGLKDFMIAAGKAHVESGGGKITIKKLLESGFREAFQDRQTEFLFSAEDILDQQVEDIGQIEKAYESVALVFEDARQAALKNTDYFLSMVSDLDVYVATSMRERSDFRRMVDFCEKVFKHPALKALQIRYFDPTVSAAECHEDKGLIECLMVKCAKVLVYCAGQKDSFGKDAEAAMALSLGKPVIFFCDEEKRKRMFADIHPLSRLIHFETGVAVGALVTTSEKQAAELLARIFENKMEYELHQHQNGLRLCEKLTNSVVRLQTKNPLLRETFWNYYRPDIKKRQQN
jgi:hypothetical protein